jgi:glycosyltransferase involved in cell wall biosynthesis
MRVLYVSKALTVAAYREKLRALGDHADMIGVIPRRWGRQVVEPLDRDGPGIRELDVWFDGRNHLHVYRGLDRVIAETRPDLVHIDEEPYSAVTAQVAQLCKRARIPTLFFAWQNLHKRLPPPFGALRSYVFRTVAGALAGTNQAADVLRRAGYTRPLGVIPQFGVDPVRFAPDPAARTRVRRRLQLDDQQLLIGFGGRLIPEKGVHLLIEALSTLPDAALAVLGDGPEREQLQRQAERLGVHQRVRFVGAVESNQMACWLAGLDLLVLPSLHTKGWVEQFGRILVEAMSCGVAVVGTNNGEIPNLIADAGLTFPENDVGALTAAIRRLLDDKALRSDLGEKGRKRVLEEFTHARIAAQTADFYNAVAPCV